MKKILKILILTTLLFLSLSIFRPTISQDSTRSEYNKTPIEDFIASVKPPDKLLQLVMEQESGFDPSRVNKRENAVGILQIRPIMLNHVNDILRKDGKDISYTLADRYDSTKSVKMWYIVQNYHNPNYDPKIACYVWNGGTNNYKKMSHAYWLKIKYRLTTEELQKINSRLLQAYVD